LSTFLVQKKKFIFDLAILLILNLLIKPFWVIIIEPKVQDHVGNIAFGEYSVLFSFSFLLTTFLDFGLTQFNNRNIAQNTHLLNKHFSKMMGLKFGLCLLFLVVTMSVGSIVYDFDVRYLKLLFILCINHFFINLIFFLRSNLLALHAFKLDSVISVLDRVIMIGLVGMMLLHWFGLQPDIMNFVYAQTIGYGITALIAFIVVLNKTHTFKMQWDKKFNLMILKKSAPYAVLVLLMTFYNRADSVMIERLLPGDTGKEQAGIYAKSFRFLDAANMIGYLFSVQLLPLFSRMLKHNENIENVVKLAFTLLITPALIVSISTIFYADHFFEKIYTGNTEGYQIFAVLMNCFTAMSLTYIFGALLTASGKLKQYNIMAVGGIIFNLVLNFILIPRYQAMGSAIASVSTQFAMGIAQVWLCYKFFHFKVNKRILLALLLFIIGLVLINYFSLNFTAKWMFNFVIMLIFSGLLAFVTGMINPKSVVRFLKYK
jgi:O-antigen/teichoic acid export membrane protein